MRQDTKRVWLSAVTLCVAGCAKSDLQLAREGRGNMRSIANSAMANAVEEKPPKILPETHFAAGLLFERQGQIDRAIPQYQKAVALNHNYVAAFHRLGLLQSAIGHHLEAAQTLQRAVALRPDNAVLHNDLGFEWMRAEQWDEAEGELRRATELQPSLATAHVNLALVQAKSGRFAESLASFQAVLPDADAYYNLGLMYRGQQRYGEAVEAFRRVLTIDAEFSAAKVQLEQLSSRSEATAPAEVAAQAPTAEPVQDPAAGPNPAEEEYAVQPPREWGTTVEDMAAILAVLDADFRKNRDSFIDGDAVDSGVADETPEEEIVEQFPEKETIEAVSPESTTTDAVSMPIMVPLAEVPCEEEMTMPFNVPPTDDTVSEFEEMEDVEPVFAESVDEAPIVAEAVEIVGPPAFFGPEFQESIAEEETAVPPAPQEPQSVSVADSWEMLQELEAKIEMLRYEIRVSRTAGASCSEPELMNQTLAEWPTWTGQTVSSVVSLSDPAETEGISFDVLDIPLVEMDADETIEFVEEPRFVALAKEIENSSDPCDPDSADVDADDIIATWPAAPTIQPTGIADSWAMLEELEARIAMLRYETHAVRGHSSDRNGMALMHEANGIPPARIEHEEFSLTAGPDPNATPEDGIEESDAPFVELDEEEAAEDVGPSTPSEAMDTKDQSAGTPGETALLWSTDFGELTDLFSIVRNETLCWNEVDAETQSLLTSMDADWPCVEGGEQAVQLQSETIPPAVQSDAPDAMNGTDDDRPTGQTVDRSGDLYATHPRGPRPRPD